MMEDIKQLFDEAGNPLYTLHGLADTLGKTEERVRQHLRAGLLILETAYGGKLYRIKEGFHIDKKGRLKPIG